MSKNILWFQSISMGDLPQVGGKNASLGEMINHLTESGILVPGGFATTADAYREFLAKSGLDKKIQDVLQGLNVNDVKALAKAGATIREAILSTPLLDTLDNDVKLAYEKLSVGAGHNASFAIRSSATAEDLPNASFAGQQETYLNVSGIENILVAIKKVYASLFTDRAIAYRDHHGFDHHLVALSVGVQRMVRSDLATSGVMFSIDTESGFKDAVFITSSYGLGETIVQGAVNPDEYYVHKPTLLASRLAILRKTLGSKLTKLIYADQGDDNVKLVDVSTQDQARFSLTDAEIEELALAAVKIENHYQRPMDIEWGKDGVDGKLYILQARPETVKSFQSTQVLERYQIKSRGKVITEGRSVGQKVGQGKVCLMKELSQMSRMNEGDVLVTDMTDPDWEPIMKRAGAIVTNRGGRTCHAAIIARELGIPAVVGCNDATKVMSDDDIVTVSCAEGETGYVYTGKLDYEIKRIDIDNLPDLPMKIMLNLGNPELAFGFAGLPNSGVGLARLEFLISNTIGIHPKALLEFAKLDQQLKSQIEKRIAGYSDPIEFYIEKLREGISTLAAAFHPKPVIVRTSDFKSNEYAHLLGGIQYEPTEENPMLGFRGASRYIDRSFKDCFELECKAIKRVRDDMGLTNVWIMIPFVRTLKEARDVIAVLSENGLSRGVNELKVIMMCEIPSNALLAEQFLEYFDGFSIGSNDLTQLTLGLDRDSSLVASGFDERDDAVKSLLHLAISACKKSGKYIGICGQGPSDHPDFAEWLMEEGIESISLNPDSVLETCLYLADKAKK